jgi:hypothetical protein
MRCEANLAWALADATSPCFTEEDATSVFLNLGGGESCLAIGHLLRIAVRERQPLPRRIVTALTAWLDCYSGSEHEPTLRNLVNEVNRLAQSQHSTDLADDTESGVPGGP